MSQNTFFNGVGQWKKLYAKKSRKAHWDYIGGEIFLGLTVLTALLLTGLIPLEKDAEYVRYIFAGITVLFFILLVPVVVGHTKFAKSPDTVLELIDETNVFNRCDNVIIRLKDIDEIQVKLNTNKYGHPYSYGTLKLVTGSKVYVMKRVHRPDEVKNSLLALKENAR